MAGERNWLTPVGQWPAPLRQAPLVLLVMAWSMPCLAGNSGSRSGYLGRHGCPLAWPRSGMLEAWPFTLFALAPAGRSVSGTAQPGPMAVEATVASHAWTAPWPSRFPPGNAALSRNCRSANALIQRPALSVALVVVLQCWAEPAPGPGWPGQAFGAEGWPCSARVQCPGCWQRLTLLRLRW